MEAMKFSYIENICICRIKVPGLDYNVPEILDATDETKPVKKLKKEKKGTTVNNKQKDCNLLENELSTTVENQTWDEKSQKFLDQLGAVHDEVHDCFSNFTDKYIKNSKKILLMFRRNLDKSTLELRHQRNPDAFFDIVNPESPDEIDDICMGKIYETIETLLPKTRIDFVEEGTKPNFKLVELFGKPEKARKGWLTICQN